jgi:hypothetical protein
VQPELPSESSAQHRHNRARPGRETSTSNRQREASYPPLNRSGDHGDLRDAVPARIQTTGPNAAVRMADRDRGGHLDTGSSAGGASRWLFQRVAQFPGPVMGAEARDEAKPAAQPAPAS